MALDKLQKAHIIIHSFAVGSAAWSGVWAWVPVAGSLLADSLGLTLLTIGMTQSLAALFEKKLEETALWSFGTIVLGGVFGTALLKAGLSLVPIFGSAVNATIARFIIMRALITFAR